MTSYESPNMNTILLVHIMPPCLCLHKVLNSYSYQNTKCVEDSGGSIDCFYLSLNIYVHAGSMKENVFVEL
jgi:hypothetical protein